MIAPELLFRMLPEDALRAMIGEKLKAPLKPEHLRLGKPKSAGGLVTKVDVTIDKGMAPVELWERVGAFTFTYNRVDMGSFTQTIPKTLNSQIPADVVDIFTGLLSPYNIPVDQLDVVPATYLSLGSVDLEADENSYRWVGGMTATLTQVIIQIDNMLLVKNFTIPFDKNYNSTTLKARLAMYINLANASVLRVPITESMFTVTSVKEHAPFVNADNTLVKLTFNNNPYKGSVEVIYQRRAFEKTFRTPVVLSGPQLTNKQELATLLSVQMGCEILATDLLSEAFPAVALGAEQKMSVSFAPASLAYIGSVLVKYSRTS